MMDQKPWQITFSDNFDELKGDIIFANQIFLDHLNQNQQIIIEGDKDEPLIFNINNNNFRIKGVYLPTTMLATKAYIPQMTTSSPNKMYQSSKNIMAIYLQKGNYLKIQDYQIEYQRIYRQISSESIKMSQFKLLQTIEQVIQQHAIELKQILHKYKITSKHLQEIQKYSSFVVFRQEDIQSLEINVVLSFDISLLLSFFRELIPFLTQQQLLGVQFTYQQIKDKVNFKHQKVFIAMARIFCLEINNSPSTMVQQAMEIQSNNKVNLYKVTLQSLIHFILIQLAQTRKQHHMREMDHQINKLLITYLPVGLVDFQEEKAKIKVTQLIGFYFLTITQHGESKRVYYNPFQLQCNIKGRVQFMNKYKKKFSLSQIKGVMRGMHNVEMEISQILIKYFRKCGNEYEIKLVIPK